MNLSSKVLQNLLAAIVCAALLSSLMPSIGQASNRTGRVIIHIGSPSVWSIGQAHYLLAKMHQDDRVLKTNLPDSTALDPNAINATRLQILRTLLDVQAEYNQKTGVENKAALREQDEKLKTRQQAQADLPKQQKQLDDLRSRLRDEQINLAALQTTDSLSDKARNVGKDNEVPPKPDDIARKVEIAKLNQKIEADKAEEARLTAEVAKTKEAANATVTPTGLNEAQLPSNTAGTLPAMSEIVKDAIKKTLASASQPRYAASIALDNFVGMQYEIIAKQLTLLRDEAGPHKRIVFLELPSSIYTVASKGDNYVAQVQWQLTRYAVKNEDKERMIDEEIRKEHSSGAHQYVRQDVVENLKADPEYRKQMEQKLKEKPEYRKRFEQRKSAEPEPDDDLVWQDVTADKARAVEIIPRQSALTVNDIQSKTTQMNFLGVVKLLSGFGLQVNYQRQRELYEQYLQQEVFASGFGKGLNTFGWTFGPLPGTKRVAPGVRTTYAVLAVPEDAVQLELKAVGAAFNRKDAPHYNLETGAYGKDDIVSKEETFQIDIPGAKSEQFYVQEAYYTPARKGATATLILRGVGFSPQMGVLVDGTALKRALSVSNTATSETTDDNGGPGSIRGRFEQISSHEVAINFSMGNAYVGTPNITLITPEKASAVNFFLLRINGHGTTSLRDLSISEPVFIEDFSVEEKLVVDYKDDAKGFVQARLRGSGLRRSADIWISNQRVPYKRMNELRDDVGPTGDATLAYPELIQSHIKLRPEEEFATQVDTGVYFLYFRKRAGSEWPVRFRQNAISGFESKEFTHKFAEKRVYEILHYTSGPDCARVDIRLFVDSRNTAVEINPNDGEMAGRPYQENDNQLRVVFNVKPEVDGKYAIERDKVTIKLWAGQAEPTVQDINLPVRPHIDRVSVLSSNPSGSNADLTLSIFGMNLQRVVKVFLWDNQATMFGSADRASLVVKLAAVKLPSKGETEIPITLETADGLRVPGLVHIKNTLESGLVSATGGTAQR